MSKPTQNAIGPQVRRFRDRAGLNQAELAARCGVIGWDVSRGTLAKVEAQLRRVTDAELFVLAKALKQDPAAFFPTHLHSVLAVLRP